MDFVSKVNSTYDNEIKKYKPAVEAIKEVARGRDDIKEIPAKDRNEITVDNINVGEEPVKSVDNKEIDR